MSSFQDKLDTISITPDKFPHVLITDPKTCEKCTCKSCLSICPTGVFEWSHQRGSNIEVRWQQCIECGACRLACPEDNIIFEYPRGGYGVSFRHG